MSFFSDGYDADSIKVVTGTYDLTAGGTEHLITDLKLHSSEVFYFKTTKPMSQT